MAEPIITFGAISGWSVVPATDDAVPGASVQNNDTNVNSPRANTLGATGNEAAAKLHSERTDVTTNYKANTIGAVTIPVNIGDLINGLILTGISVQTTADDYCTMSLTGHNHTANAHSASPALRKVAHGISLAAGFGCTDFMGGTVGAVASPVSSGINISCQHKDEDAANGDHLVGENYDPRMEANTEWVGVPTKDAAAVWDVTSAPVRTDNQGFTRRTVNGVKPLAFA